ncbi:MAG: ribosomal-processing cysteine protease Prp [Oscillospiraceae bacterium]|nr:ribosomal-processing cysteine protease Prp [Ruminococcus sp.]MCD8345510.1 ribosomal-processing cysteine protease Prp [Oscillospiraceae bacterium]
MITALFKVSEAGSYKGFSVSGHSGYSEAGSDIVCAAVSSAVMLTVNSCIDGFDVNAEPEVIDDTVKFIVNKPSENADRLIGSLREHLEALSEEYPDNIAVVVK